MQHAAGSQDCSRVGSLRFEAASLVSVLLQERTLEHRVVAVNFGFTWFRGWERNLVGCFKGRSIEGSSFRWCRIK